MPALSISPPSLALSWGTLAFAVGKARAGTASDHTHRWMVFVRGAAGQDITYAVEKVVFTLHPTIKDHVREVSRPPFQVTETGWGSFEILIDVHFRAALGAPGPLHLSHLLKLFHDAPAAAPERPVLSESFDEVVFNEPTPEALSVLRRGPLGDAPPYPHQEHLSLFSAEADLAAIRAARQWVREKLDEQAERLARREAEVAALRQHCAALGMV